MAGVGGEGSLPVWFRSLMEVEKLENGVTLHFLLGFLSSSQLHRHLSRSVRSQDSQTQDHSNMASEFVKNLKEEVTCPICLDLMVQPVSADCGHSFCQACITLNYESSKCNKEEFLCPVCRVSYLLRNLRPNRHVANIVERLKELKPSPEEEQKVFYCARHGEKLQLFCKEDTMAICWLCERSQEHRGHQTALIEEVAQEYKEKLQAALQKLMADKKEFENWKDDLQKERTYWEASGDPS